MNKVVIERPMHVPSVIHPQDGRLVNVGTDIVWMESLAGLHGYNEIFPSHLPEMLSWLAGTQRMVVGSAQPIMGRTEAVINLRQAIYQVVEEWYPGGLRAFLAAFPAIELEAPGKS